MEHPEYHFDVVVPGIDNPWVQEEIKKTGTKYHHPGWVSCALSVSFRVPLNICQWVNQQLNPNNLKFATAFDIHYWEAKKDIFRSLWGTNGICSDLSREDAGAVHESIYYGSETQKDEVINHLIKVMNEFKSNEIVFLATSFRKMGKSSPIASILDALEERTPFRFAKEKMWTCKSEETKSGEKKEIVEEVSEKHSVPENIIVARTVNGAKGDEWDCVICLDLFSNYWERHGERSSPDRTLELFCKMYVAATRAKKRLEIVHTSPDVNRLFATLRRTTMARKKDWDPQKELTISSHFILMNIHPRFY